jgi:hypothetical protein
MNAFGKFNGDYAEGSVLVCRFIHASTGLNLTGGPNSVSNIVFIELPGDVSSLNRAIKRIHRIGSLSKCVSIRVLLYSETQDAQKWAQLQDCENSGLAHALKEIDRSNTLTYRFQDYLVDGSDRYFVEMTNPNSFAHANAYNWRNDTKRIFTCLEEIKSTSSSFIGRPVNSLECRLTGKRHHILPSYYFECDIEDAKLDEFVVNSRTTDESGNNLRASYGSRTRDSSFIRSRWIDVTRTSNALRM